MAIKNPMPFSNKQSKWTTSLPLFLAPCHLRHQMTMETQIQRKTRIRSILILEKRLKAPQHPNNQCLTLLFPQILNQTSVLGILNQNKRSRRVCLVDNPGDPILLSSRNSQNQLKIKKRMRSKRVSKYRRRVLE
jgi:hypothetical protein